VAAGVTFTQPPTEVDDQVIAVFNDTCGNVIQIVSVKNLTQERGGARRQRRAAGSHRRCHRLAPGDLAGPRRLLHQTGTRPLGLQGHRLPD